MGVGLAVVGVSVGVGLAVVGVGVGVAVVAVGVGVGLAVVAVGVGVGVGFLVGFPSATVAPSGAVPAEHPAKAIAEMAANATKRNLIISDAPTRRYGVVVRSSSANVWSWMLLDALATDHCAVRSI